MKGGHTNRRRAKGGGEDGGASRLPAPHGIPRSAPMRIVADSVPPNFRVEVQNAWGRWICIAWTTEPQAEAERLRGLGKSVILEDTP